MEQLVVSLTLGGSEASGKVGKPEHGRPDVTRSLRPVKITESGVLILDPNQTEDAYMEQLQKLMHSKETLQKAGYVMQPLTEFELDQKKKCARCHKCESTGLYAMSSMIRPMILTNWAVVFKKAFKHTLDGKLKPGSDTVIASPANKGSPGGTVTTAAAAKGAHGGEHPTGPPADRSRQECKYHKGYFNGRVRPRP
jgi:hypothetical protein